MGCRSFLYTASRGYEILIKGVRNEKCCFDILLLEV